MFAHRVEYKGEPKDENTPDVEAVLAQDVCVY